MKGKNFSFLRTLPVTQMYCIRWPPFHGSVKKSVHSSLVTVAREGKFPLNKTAI